MSTKQYALLLFAVVISGLIGGAAFSSILSGGMLIAQNQSIPKSIEAEEFVLKDRNGKVRARLGMKHYPTTAIKNKSFTKKRNPHGPYLKLMDENGIERIVLGIDITGKTVLIFNDHEGTKSLDLYAYRSEFSERINKAPHTSKGISFYNIDGEPRSNFSYVQGTIWNGSHFTMWDKDSKNMISLRSDIGGPMIEIGDAHTRGELNKQYISIGGFTPMISFYERNGKSDGITMGMLKLNKEIHDMLLENASQSRRR